MRTRDEVVASHRGREERGTWLEKVSCRRHVPARIPSLEARDAGFVVLRFLAKRFAFQFFQPVLAAFCLWIELHELLPRRIGALPVLPSFRDL